MYENDNICVHLSVSDVKLIVNLQCNLKFKIMIRIFNIMMIMAYINSFILLPPIKEPANTVRPGRRLLKMDHVCHSNRLFSFSIYHQGKDKSSHSTRDHQPTVLFFQSSHTVHSSVG